MENQLTRGFLDETFVVGLGSLVVLGAGEDVEVACVSVSSPTRVKVWRICDVRATKLKFERLLPSAST